MTRGLAALSAFHAYRRRVAAKHGHQSLAGLTAELVRGTKGEGADFIENTSPVAMAWLGMDFGQKDRAFPVQESRAAARRIVSQYFAGATFFVTSGLWEGTENGGMAVQLYAPLFGSVEEQTKSIAEFVARCRSVAWEVKATFRQMAVSMVIQLPDGRSFVEFVGENATKKVDEVTGRVSYTGYETKPSALQRRDLKQSAWWARKEPGQSVTPEEKAKLRESVKLAHERRYTNRTTTVAPETRIPPRRKAR
jgi:hypothetical protein